MNSSHPPLGDFAAMPSIASSSTSRYDTPQISALVSMCPRNDEHFPIMPDYDIDRQNLHALSAPLTNACWTSDVYGNDIPSQSINITSWMTGNFAPAADEDISLTAPKVKEKKAQGMINFVQNVLPPINEGASPSAVAPLQNKRRRKGLHSDKDEDDGAERRRRKRGTSAVGSPLPTQAPQYPRVIPQEIRPLVDADFEHSCEWCPFYLHEPLKHFPKPYTSCTKQRAEISHIITHLISDHHLIRGRSAKRRNQRYLTCCSGHRPERKGKSDCDKCSQVEEWSVEELDNQAHQGPSVCLRCYTKLKDKAALYEHLHMPNICMYKEDLMMKAKSRTLYEVFCSEVEVPKFRPPPETSAPRDGARKRNMKQNNRTSSDSIGAPGSTRPPQPRQHRPILSSPSSFTQSLALSSPQKEINPEPSDDVLSSYSANPLQIVCPQQEAQAPPFLQTSPATFITRQPMPSRTSDLDETDLMNYHNYSSMVPCENQRAPVSTMAPPAKSRFLETPRMQLPGDKFPAYDSAIGSDLAAVQSQNALDDSIFLPDDAKSYTPNDNMPMGGSSSFFDDSWNNTWW